MICCGSWRRGTPAARRRGRRASCGTRSRTPDGRRGRGGDDKSLRPWPTPAEMPTPSVDGETEPEEWPTLDAARPPRIAGDFVRAVEPHTEADPVALLASFLVAFGNVVGRTAYVRVGGDRHYGNEFICLVGASSRARKGTSLGYVLDAFEGVDEAWTKRRVNGLSSGEGMIAAVAGNVEPSDEREDHDPRHPPVGHRGRVRQRAPAAQAGGEHAVGRDPQRLGPWRSVHAHEAGAAACAERPRQHPGSHHEGRAGPLPRQRGRFNGFCNRFLWVLCRRSKLVPDASTPTLDGLRQRLTLVAQRAKRLGEVRRSESARALAGTCTADLVAEKRGIVGRSHVTGRSARGAAVPALRPAGRRGHDRRAAPAGGVALWRYCDESARHDLRRRRGLRGRTLEAKIRRLVRERPGIGRTELRDAISHKIKADELERALAWLEATGELRRESVSGTERLYPVDKRRQMQLRRRSRPRSARTARPDTEFFGSLAAIRAAKAGNAHAHAHAAGGGARHARGAARLAERQRGRVRPA